MPNRSNGPSSTVKEHVALADTLSIMLTHQCPAECADCATLSGPHVRNHLQVDVALSYISQAVDAGMSLVVFTGGEATLRWADLIKCIKFATGLGLRSRLVTNGHWATSLSVARDKLDVLVSAGLCELNFSTGDEHVRFVPLSRVINATLAASSTGLTLLVMIESRRGSGLSRYQFLAELRQAGLGDEFCRRVSIVESPWMPLNSQRLGSYADSSVVNEQNIRRQAPCESVLGTYTVQPDGTVGCCCGISMRKIPELAQWHHGASLLSVVGEAEQDFVKLMLRYVGPFRILSWAAQKSLHVQWENMYAHHCQACLRIFDDGAVRKVLRTHYKEFITEVVESAQLERRYKSIFLSERI